MTQSSIFRPQMFVQFYKISFGRIFISTLFIIEAIKKFLFKEETIFYMEDHGIPEILFYPSLIFELVFPILLIIGYQTRISAVAMFIFTIIVTIIFHNDFENQMQLTALLKNLSIAGGFLIIASNEPKICSIDYMLKPKAK